MPLSKNYELGTLANTLDIDQSTGEITSLTIDTDVVSEGANLYFTSERVDDRVAALIQAGTNITVSYDDVLGTLTINASDTEDDLSNNTTSDLAEGTNLYYTNARADARIAAASIDALSDVDITTSAPSNGQSLVWDNANSKFIPGDSFSQSDFDTAFAAKSTTNLSEGTNLYYTDARADARIAAATTTDLTEGTNLYYTNARADARIAAADTDDLSEGSTNLYFTDARADARIASATTSDLTEGTNLYYTDARADARAQLKVDALVDSAPNTLDTLNELASALGDDANFSTTITNSIATKLATADFNSTFDTRLGTKTTANLTEGSNLYFTDARADARIAAADTDDLSEGSTNLYFTNARADARIAAADTDAISEGSTNLYYTNARADARIALQAGANLDLSSKSTSDLSEGTNLYYTNARVDAHLNQSNPTSGYVLSWNGSDYAWIDNTGYTAFNTDFDTRLGTKTTANLTEGSNLYFTNTRADARVDAGFTAKSTSDLSEGTNLYYTNARADARIALQVGSNLDLSSKDTNSLSEGSNNLYYTNARADARVNLQTGSNLNLSSKDTDALSEGSNNLYFTNARVQGTTINAGSLRGSVNNATVQYGTSYSGTPAQGSFFFDSLNAKLKVYNGSAFVDAVPAGSGGGGGGGASDAVATFRKYTFDISSTTNSVSGKDSVVVTAGSFVTGYQYQIISVGNTDFTAIGASGNTVGVTFTATGAGSGTGTAGHILNYATSNQNVEVYRNGAKMVEGSSDDYVATTGTSVNFTYNLQSGDVVEVQVYELLTNDAYYLKTETYTQTQTNSQISTAVAGYLPLVGGTLTGNLRIDNSASTTVRLQLHNSGSNDYASIYADTATAYKNLILNPTGGNIGIGTTNPTQKLNVHASDSRIEISTDSAGTTKTQLQFTTDRDGTPGYGFMGLLHNNGSRLLRIGTNGNSGTDYGIQLDANNNVDIRGNVGIGTTSPNSKLEVATSSNTNSYSDGAIQVVSSSPIAFVAPSNLNPSLNRWGFTLREGGEGHFGIRDYRMASTRVTIDDSGKVGIGTTSPGEKLHVYGSGQQFIKVETTTTGAAAFVGMRMQDGDGDLGSIGDFGSGRRAFMLDTGSGVDMMFFTDNQNNSANTPRMTISSSGKIGINTLPLTDTTGTLHVGGGLSVGSGNHAGYHVFSQHEGNVPSNTTRDVLQFEGPAYARYMTVTISGYLCRKEQYFSGYQSWDGASNGNNVGSTVNGTTTFSNGTNSSDSRAKIQLECSAATGTSGHPRYKLKLITGGVTGQLYDTTIVVKFYNPPFYPTYL